MSELKVVRGESGIYLGKGYKNWETTAVGELKIDEAGPAE
jgi:hypothetical protein